VGNGVLRSDEGWGSIAEVPAVFVGIGGRGCKGSSELIASLRWRSREVSGWRRTGRNANSNNALVCAAVGISQGDRSGVGACPPIVSVGRNGKGITLSADSEAIPQVNHIGEGSQALRH
jgi:hypothetical protein